MFRNFDNRDRYYDLERNPLQGCVQFMVKDGSTVANIYDSDETPISNPQLTDILGRTQQQVFVDSEVIAYMYKYVGDGRLADQEEQSIDTSDVTKWALQYTVESAAIDQKDVEGLSAMGVSTMDALRALDPYEVPLVDGIRIICLHGYYEAADKEPVWYIWEDESEQPDNNGSVIQSDTGLTGRWRMVRPTEHCDSRHFGVFPQDSFNVQIDQSTQITQLFDYCNLESLKPFFNGSEDYPYFIYDQINVTSRNAIEISDRTVFVDKLTSTMHGNIDIDSSFRFMNGKTHLASKGIRTSWNASGFSGYDEVIIDATTPQTLFENARVVVKVSTGNKIFNRCEIVSENKLGNNTFSHCKLTADMFANAEITPTVNDTDSIDIDDFRNNVRLYIKLRDQQTSNVYDMQMATVPGSWSRDGVYWKNAVFANANLYPTSNVTLDGCYGTVTIYTQGSTDMAIANCQNIAVTFAAANFNNIMVTNTSAAFTAPNGINCNGITMIDSVTSGATITCAGAVNLDNCTVTNQIGVLGNFSAQFCTLNSPISHVQSPIIVSEIQSCRLGAVYNFAGSQPNTVVNAKWCNNVGVVASPIQFDRTNLNLTDSAHTYVYSGNSGTCLAENPVIDRTLTVVNNTSIISWAVPDDSVAYYPGDPARYAANWMGLYTDNFYDDVNNYTNGLSGIVPFFRIGTDTFNVSVSWRVENHFSTATICVDDIIVPVDFPLQANFVEGFGWKLNMRRAPSHQDSNRFSVTRIGLGVRGGSWVGATIQGKFTVHPNP